MITSPTESPTGLSTSAPDPLHPVARRDALLGVDVAFCVATVVLIGLADFMTGDTIDFAVVYVVPIAWATWRVSRGAGIAVSTVSAVVAIAAHRAGALPDDDVTLVAVAIARSASRDGMPVASPTSASP